MFVPRGKDRNEFCIFHSCNRQLPVKTILQKFFSHLNLANAWSNRHSRKMGGVYYT